MDQTNALEEQYGHLHRFSVEDYLWLVDKLNLKDTLLYNGIVYDVNTSTDAPRHAAALDVG